MKGGNFCGFLFTSLGKETLSERVILLQNQGYIFREATLQGGIVSDWGVVGAVIEISIRYTL